MAANAVEGTGEKQEQQMQARQLQRDPYGFPVTIRDWQSIPPDASGAAR